MKKKLITGGVILALLATIGLVVNFVILPATAKEEKARTEKDAPCDGPVSVAGVMLDWALTKTDSFDGQMVTIEGYPELPFLMRIDSGRASVHLTPRMNQASGGMVILMIKEGKCGNMLKTLGTNYEPTDLVLYDNDRDSIQYGQKASVTGKAKFEDGKYTITVEKIGQAAGEFDYAKNCSRLGTDVEKGDLVYTEGKLVAPDEQRSVRLSLLLQDELLKASVDCKFKFGPLNNQADELPEDGYSDEDVLIRDNSGKQLKAGDRVRVYGVWSSDAVWVERVEALQ